MNVLKPKYMHKWIIKAYTIESNQVNIEVLVSLITTITILTTQGLTEVMPLLLKTKKINFSN